MNGPGWNIINGFPAGCNWNSEINAKEKIMICSKESGH